MTILPFVSLGIGIIIGIYVKSSRFIQISDKVTTVALAFLMLSIGLGIGLDKTIIGNFANIGFHCAIIALSAIFCSVFFTVICEKTVLPLGQIDKELQNKNIDLYSTKIENEAQDKEHSEKGNSDKKDTDMSLIWIMPISLVLGLILGIMTRSYMKASLVDTAFVFSLIALYVCVGISQGANRDVFKYIKELGLRVLWLPVATLVGSITGGLIAGLVLRIPLTTSVISAGGMSYYSITGAFMTATYGLEVGTYGFMVNIMREIFTVLLMPLLVKISLGSPIAAGASGNMDTMLAPVTKFVGVQLGLVALICGTILSFIVPLLLPVLAAVIG